jgi:hypothetical protein
MNPKKLNPIGWFLLVILTSFMLSACGNTNGNLVSAPSATEQIPTSDTLERDNMESTGYPIEHDAAHSYPSPGTTADTGYPAPNIYGDLLTAPPNPEIDLPPADMTTGVIGGVLIREVVDHGFEPLTPASISLADVILTTDGRPAFIRAGDDAQKAQLFPTGIFIFQQVPPGEYGFMVDVGYTIFPITNDDGTPLTITVEAGGVINLGQVITPLP